MSSVFQSRVTNVAFESNEVRGPIAGLFTRFNTAPTFTFMDAIQDVLSDVDLSKQATIHGMSREELKNTCYTLMGLACEKKRELGETCPLNEHQIAALYLYTAEFYNGECYYSVVNKLLRDQNREGVVPFAKIIWLTMLASSKCPAFSGHVLHRGIKLTSAEELGAVEAIYADGRTVTWGQFSSCSPMLNVQENFLGQSGYRVLFNIETNHDNSVPNTARMISHMSLVPSEEEVLLPPNTRVFVQGSYSPSPDMVITSLRVAPSLDNIFPGVETVTSVFSVPAPVPRAERGVKVFQNGDRYEGDLLDGNIRHGKGTMTYANRDFVMFLYTSSNGTRYEGDFKDDKRHGKGSLIYADGSRYEGDWVNDTMTGKGVFIGLAGLRYEGDVKDDRQHGRGAIILPNGDRYEGDWVYDSMTGKGVFTWANGDRYEGSFKDGKKHGKGTMFYANRSIGYGHEMMPFASGRNSSTGLYTSSNGTRYEGDFKDDKRHGKGTLIYADSSRYEGGWVNDTMTGKGVFIGFAGLRYEGDVKDDRQHGRGTIIFPNGNRFEGDWVCDSMTGKGEYTWANGDRYEGDFKDNKKHGKGIFISRDGTVTRGEWNNDERIV